MEENKKTYWKGIEELTNDTEFVRLAEKEFPQYLSVKDSYGDNTEQDGTSRRDFLKLMGFSVAAVSLAACEAPVRKAIPWLNKPESMEPGIANYYASTYLDGSDYCAIVVKTREGRPIFIEGNTFSNVTLGGTSPRVNASIMTLYDIEKAKAPMIGGKESKWDIVDKEIIAKLQEVSAAGKGIRIVSNTVMSPSTKRVIADFITKYPTAKHVMYDADSAYGILQANKITKGKAVVPSYDFSKAAVVVSFGADFLGSWISEIEYNKQFAQTRKIGKDKKDMSRLYVFEPNLSITGASADYRTPIKPSQEGLVVAKLYNLVAQGTGAAAISTPDVQVAELDRCAKDLIAAKGRALVVSGSNDPAVQVLINGINDMLGSYGATINMEVPSFQKQGNDVDMANFITEVNNGAIGAVIFYNANPVYDHPMGKTLEGGLAKVQLTVATGDRLNETAAKCTYLCPDSHFLESWNDAEPKPGFFSLGQPTIRPIFNTRQVQQSLLNWAGVTTDYFTYIRDFWRTQLMPMQTAETEFEAFWNRCLHNGVFEPKVGTGYTSIHAKNEAAATAQVTDANSAAGLVGQKYKAAGNDTELVLFQNSILGVGTQANNPYLHETPDPITKMCWGNYVTVSPAMAKTMGLGVYDNQTDFVSITVNGTTYKDLPAIIQPGQAPGTIGIALGYGRPSAGKVATEAGGVNAFPFAQFDGSVRYAVTSGVTITKTGERKRVAQTQTHHTFMGRETIIQEAVLAQYQKDEKAGRFFPKIATASGKKNPTDLSIWDIENNGYKDYDAQGAEKDGIGDPKTVTEAEKNNWYARHAIEADVHKYPQHHWGMVIDLNSCTGCSACVVACHIENNVPIVGAVEIKRRREMHWLRIDRYYSSIEPSNSHNYDKLEIAADNPEVVFQPMLCQHCNNAPCETVCPVAATTHSSEGLNQMAYNRCIGTKYCANNCPYKVRRFNWFKYFNNDEFNYHMNDNLGKMVLNPDVTVRSRGVMEKCSFCVQRIQAGKLKAKMDKRPLEDGEVVTACQQACPSDAIMFGDLNNPESKISRLLDQEVSARAYNVLSEINTRPNIWYLTKIRNKDQEKA